MASSVIKCIDDFSGKSDICEQIPIWLSTIPFTENFFYNSRTSFTKAEVEKVVMTSGKRRYQRINFFHDCEQLYERFIRGHYARGSGVRKCNLPLRSPSTVIWTGTTGLYFAFCRSLCKRLCDQSSPSKLKIGQIFCHWVKLIFIIPIFQ